MKYLPLFYRLLFLALPCGMFVHAPCATSATNAVISTTRVLSVNGNGVLLAPTNFWSANANGMLSVVGNVTSAASSTNTTGTILLNNNAVNLTNLFLARNLVPTNAVFDNGNGPLGATAFAMPILPANQLYYVYYTGDPANGEGLGYVVGGTANAIAPITPVNGNSYQSGLFSLAGVTQPVYIYNADNPPPAGTPVTTAIYAVPANKIQAGAFGGTFDGLISGNSSVPDTVFSTNVVLKSKYLFSFADSSAEANWITSCNTMHGSTLNILASGTKGYADINFFTGPDLRGALGCGVEGTNQWPYNQPYWECYGGNSYAWVQYGLGIFGCVNGVNGNFQWFANHNNTDGSGSNTVFFETVRSNKSVAIGGPTGGFLWIKNSSSAQAPVLSGTNAGVALWASNGVLYARTTVNGTNTVDKQIAP